MRSNSLFLLIPTDLDKAEFCPTNSPKALSKVDQTLPEGNVEELNILFECSRDDSEQSQYYDLILNPERYTGMGSVIQFAGCFIPFASFRL